MSYKVYGVFSNNECSNYVHSISLKHYKNYYAAFHNSEEIVMIIAYHSNTEKYLLKHFWCPYRTYKISYFIFYILYCTACTGFVGVTHASIRMHNLLNHNYIAWHEDGMSLHKVITLFLNIEHKLMKYVKPYRTCH